MNKRKQESEERDILDHLIDKYSKDDPNFKLDMEKERQRMDMAQQIYDARMEAGLTQSQLAKLVGTTPSVISRLEDSDYEGHSMNMIRRIAKALGKEFRFEFV